MLYEVLTERLTETPPISNRKRRIGHLNRLCLPMNPGAMPSSCVAPKKNTKSQLEVCGAPRITQRRGTGWTSTSVQFFQRYSHSSTALARRDSRDGGFAAAPIMHSMPFPERPFLPCSYNFV